MTPKKLQKTFYISDEHIKSFFDQRTEDIARRKKISTSYVIEQALLNVLLPYNTDARSFVFNYLYNSADKFSVRTTIDNIFAWNSAGVDWSSKHDNFRPLVEFCLFNMDGSPLLPKNNIALHSFGYSLNSVILRTDKELKLLDNTVDNSQYLCSVDYAKSLFAQAQDTTTDVGIKFFFEVFLDLWDVIKGWAMTYRALSALASMSTFREDAVTRNALVDVLDLISKEW